MSNLLYVDNSNVWIEGMRLSAVQRKLASSLWDATEKKLVDYEWKLDFGKLLRFAGGNSLSVKRAVLFGSRPPANDSLWSAARDNGFEVIVHDRSVSGKEKKIDTNLTVEMMSDSFQLVTPEKDQMTLISGDADYVPVIESLKSRGINVRVVFWNHAARELKDVASSFINLDPYLGKLAR